MAILLNVKFRRVSKEDVARIHQWLGDTEVNESWYGFDEEGEPPHIGYFPSTMLEASDLEWEAGFASGTRRFTPYWAGPSVSRERAETALRCSRTPRPGSPSNSRTKGLPSST